MLRVVLLVILFLALIGSLPLWSFNSGWGYYPGSGLSIVIIVLLLVRFSEAQPGLGPRADCALSEHLRQMRA